MAGTDTSDLANPKLLEKIDQLFKLNIGEHVALPQLLVVGDQSSGKSSVLEGLTSLPFPRDSGLCTRFATQITFRRSTTTRVSVSIIPAGDAQSEYAEKLRAWKKDELQALDRQTFAAILEEVYLVMGLGKQDDNKGELKTFSDDVLRIEICGPDKQHLSFIDVPGIFKKTTAGVTTKEDMQMVRNMVSAYMKNPRSVILAVIPANVDIATQEILEMAEMFDPNGLRTLGVLTKPDLVDKGAEHNVVSIMEGKSHFLNLGWCILKNPGQQELKKPSADRHAAEKEFFKTENRWHNLPKDRVGTKSLRARLVEILGEMIQREFSQVKLDVSRLLKTRRRELEAMGPSRDTKETQYRFILDLATRFQEITGLALKAQYGSNDIFDKSDSLKLATAVVKRNGIFSDDVWKRGHTMKFNKEELSSKDIAASQYQFGKASTTTSTLPKTAPKPTVTRHHKRKYEELDDVLQESWTIDEPSSTAINGWLREVHEGSRGFELGTFDASLLPNIWKKQSANWDKLALGYISDIVSLVHDFTMELLNFTCKDKRVLKGLQSVLIDNLIDRYKKGVDHTLSILAVERAGTPLTNNHYFAENLEKSRQDRMKSRLERVAYSDNNGMKVVRLDSTLQTTNASNVEHTICDLHDILKSYYKVARKRFVDVVCMQAADHHLVNGPDTPIKVFSPSFVSELTPEQLDIIAGEDMSTRKKRARLQRDIENLEKGRKVLI